MWGGVELINNKKTFVTANVLPSYVDCSQEGGLPGCLLDIDADRVNDQCREGRHGEFNALLELVMVRFNALLELVMVRFNALLELVMVRFNALLELVMVRFNALLELVMVSLMLF